MLDDIFAELLMLIPKLGDITHVTPTLKTLDEPLRSKNAGYLVKELEQYMETIDQFLMLPHVVETLEPKTRIPHRSKHEECCPPAPFTPYHMQFPPAGVLRMVIFGIKWYIRTVVYPAIRNESNSLECSPLEYQESSYYSLEICKTFAGIEETLDDSDSLIPLFSLVMMSTTTCSRELRLWLWYKLRHFEALGYLAFEPMKKYLAAMWGLRDIVTIGFSRTTPSDVARRLRCEDIIAAVKEVTLEDGESCTGTEENVEGVNQ